jgi:hypothetical protein
MLMKNKQRLNRWLNILNLFISIFVTGLILFNQFHMGDGAHQKEWLGIEKSIWLLVHKVSAIGFLSGLILHLQMHWKYIKSVTKKWGRNLPKKIKSRTREQTLLLAATMIVLWAGFYAWIVMPNAILENKVYHNWIDVHNGVGIIYLIGLTVHIIRRWRRIFTFKKKNNEWKFMTKFNRLNTNSQER